MPGVVVLVQRGPEWRITAGTTGTGGLFPVPGANSRAAHQVCRLVRVVAAALLGPDPPDHDTKDTHDEGTTNTHHNSDDDLLVLRRQAGVIAVLAGSAQGRRAGGRSIIGSTRHGCRNRSSADGADGSDGAGSSSGVVRGSRFTAG